MEIVLTPRSGTSHLPALLSNRCRLFKDFSRTMSCRCSPDSILDGRNRSECVGSSWKLRLAKTLRQHSPMRPLSPSRPNRAENFPSARHARTLMPGSRLPARATFAHVAFCEGGPTPYFPHSWLQARETTARPRAGPRPREGIQIPPRPSECRPGWPRCRAGGVKWQP